MLDAPQKVRISPRPITSGWFPHLSAQNGEATAGPAEELSWDNDAQRLLPWVTRCLAAGVVEQRTDAQGATQENDAQAWEPRGIVRLTQRYSRAELCGQAPETLSKTLALLVRPGPEAPEPWWSWLVGTGAKERDLAIRWALGLRFQCAPQDPKVVGALRQWRHAARGHHLWRAAEVKEAHVGAYLPAWLVELSYKTGLISAVLLGASVLAGLFFRSQLVDPKVKKLLEVGSATLVVPGVELALVVASQLFFQGRWLPATPLETKMRILNERHRAEKLPTCRTQKQADRALLHLLVGDFQALSVEEFTEIFSLPQGSTPPRSASEVHLDRWYFRSRIFAGLWKTIDAEQSIAGHLPWQGELQDHRGRGPRYF